MINKLSNINIDGYFYLIFDENCYLFGLIWQFLIIGTIMIKQILKEAIFY